MKREWPFLALEVVLLLVLLQSNAPEVWFWFIALLVLLTWRSLALRSRLEQRHLAQAATEEPPPPPAA
ncbi:MAG: hypothetical protein RLZZ459_274 [Cyanobacteriota bacterium]|jgi:hypothetical protein